MSADAEAAQAEDQTVQVELEFHHEEKRENKTMDVKLVVTKFNPNRKISEFREFSQI
jgi:hypothetical protein